jgi:hypothetical protein
LRGCRRWDRGRNAQRNQLQEYRRAKTETIGPFAHWESINRALGPCQKNAGGCFRCAEITMRDMPDAAGRRPYQLNLLKIREAGGGTRGIREKEA